MAEIKIELPKEFRKVDPFLLQLLVQRILKEELEDFERVEKILSKSKLTKTDALKLGKKFNKGLARRYK